mgnify:CR=1 FL=1
MTSIIYVINPMLRSGVAAEWLRIFERFPGAVDLPVGWVVLDFIQHAVSRHDLRHPICIPAAMDEEASIIKHLNEGLAMAQLSILEMLVNVVAQNPLRPVLVLLCKQLKMHSLFVARNDPVTNAEAGIPHHNLPRAMQWLGHLDHCLARLRHPIVLQWERPRTIRLLRSVFPFDQLDPKHYQLATISVGNCAVLIAKQMRLARHDHKARAVLTQPRAHQLIQTADPRRDVVSIVMIIECVQHITDFVEPVHKTMGCHRWWWFFGETDVARYVGETISCHELVQPEGCTRKQAHGPLRPPLVTIVDPLETCHEEVASKINVELGEGEMITLYLFVGGRAKSVLGPIF